MTNIIIISHAINKNIPWQIIPASFLEPHTELLPPYWIVQLNTESSEPLQLTESMCVGKIVSVNPFLAAMAP